MPDAQEDWIAKRVDAACTACPVADAVALAIKAQLGGTMRERALSPAERFGLANTLLGEANNPASEDAAK